MTCGQARSCLYLISASGPKKRCVATEASGRTLQYSSRGRSTAGGSRAPRARDRVKPVHPYQPQGASATSDRVSALLPPRGPACIRGQPHEASPHTPPAGYWTGRLMGFGLWVQTLETALSLQALEAEWPGTGNSRAAQWAARPPGCMETPPATIPRLPTDPRLHGSTVCHLTAANTPGPTRTAGAHQGPRLLATRSSTRKGQFSQDPGATCVRPRRTSRERGRCLVGTLTDTGFDPVPAPPHACAPSSTPPALFCPWHLVSADTPSPSAHATGGSLP